MFVLFLLQRVGIPNALTDEPCAACVIVRGGGGALAITRRDPLLLERCGDDVFRV